MVTAMWLTKVKTVSALLLVGGCLAVGLGVLLCRAVQAAPAGTPPPGAPQAGPAGPPKRLAAGVPGPEKWRPLKVLQAEKRPDSLSFTPDARLVAGVLNERDKKPTDAGSALRLWDVRTGEVKPLLDGDAEFQAGDLWWFHAVRFSPDGKTLAASAGGFRRVGKGARVAGAVRLFDVATGKRQHTLEHDNQVWELAFSPDGKSLAGCSTGQTVPVWDVESGTLQRTIEVADTQVFAVAFSPDGKTVASGGSTYKDGEEAEIKLWDVASGKLLRAMADKEHARSLTFSADGKFLAAGATSGVKVWDVKTGKLKHALGTGLARRAVFAPDGKTLAAGTEEGEVNVWDAQTGELRQTLKGHVGYVHALDFSRDGRTLATGGSDQSIRLWRLGK
jgi:WD40 repeat protein